MLAPAVPLLTFLALHSLFPGLSAMMMPPLVSQSPECFVPNTFNHSSPFAQDCRHFFGPLSYASADTVHPILKNFSVMTAKPISQGTKSFLRLSYGRCQFTAVGLVKDIEEEGPRPEPLSLTEWVQLWPTFTDSLQYLLTQCLGNNLGGEALLQYMSKSRASKVKILIENKSFQGYPTHLYDFAFDYYRAGAGAGAAAGGLPPSPVSSNSSFSRHPSSTANDYRFMDGFFPADHPSRLRRLPRAVMERIGEHVCHESQNCREFMTSEEGRRLTQLTPYYLAMVAGAETVMPAGNFRRWYLYWQGAALLLQAYKPY